MFRNGNRTGGRVGLALYAWMVGCLGLVAASAQATVGFDTAWQTEERYWNFRVFLDDREIGSHEFRVKGEGAEQRVEIDAKFDVKVLFITAYSYRHNNVEEWRNGCLVSIRSATDDNGDRREVVGRSSPRGFTLGEAEEIQELPGDCIRSFAYWNADILSAGRLLNAQTGELVDVSIDDRGPDSLQVGERVLPARQYRITMEDGTIDLWYHSDTGQWLALEAPTEGGRVLRYEPVGLPPVQGGEDRLAMD